MPDAAWRCSQCGTVNAPAANACRTCGHWPSLFDLESSTLDTETQTSQPREEAAVYSPEISDAGPPAPEPQTLEMPSGELPSEFDPDTAADETARPKPSWQRFARLAVPVGVAIYLLVSALTNR